jgi:hypothetical protein
VLESPQVMYKICRVYIKEDISYSNLDPIPRGKRRKWAPKVALPSPAICWCSLTCPELGTINGSPPSPFPSLFWLSRELLLLPHGALPQPWPSPLPAPPSPTPSLLPCVEEMAGGWRSPLLSLWRVGPRPWVRTHKVADFCSFFKYSYLEF